MVLKALSAWPRWSGYLTAVWSFSYGLLGIWWATGGSGYPFAVVPDDRATMSLLEGAPVEIVAPAMTVVGLGGAGLALMMALRKHPSSWLPTAVAGLLAVSLTMLIPDYTMLAMLALAPAILVFAFTGVPGEQDGVGDILYWHRMNLIILFAGGVLWAVTAIAYHRRTRRACTSCGRSGSREPQWQEPASALRWGRRAVAAAVLLPVPYEITRLAWYLGWPLGITDEFHQMMSSTPGMLEMGLALGIMSIGGGILTHGLVQRWGEVYPRWIWWRAGRPVPPALAIVPASVVALTLVPAGLMNLRTPFEAQNWAVNGPGVLWAFWGLALGLATYAYYLRRRAQCRRCGQGATSRSDVLAARSRGWLGGSRRAGSPATAPHRSRTRSARSATA